MFKKLKRKIILTNVLTSTAVLLIAFSSIYLVAAGSSNNRAEEKFDRNPATQTQFAENPELAAKFNEQMHERIEAERAESLRTLLISLIVTGLAVESIIALISIYLAEQAVKPVREAYNAQKDFVANASHEIKTPLAVIQANLEAADIKNNKWIDNAIKKTYDLAELNSQLIALARSESIPEEKNLKETSINKLVLDTISAFDAKASEQEKTISHSSTVTNDYKRKINRQAFEQILSIYLDNAIKYSKSKVNIEVKKDRILVASDGKPIPESKLPHLFDRFYQADKSSEGIGLGLAIAKSVAEKNGWKVEAYVDKNNRTNVFTLDLK